MSQILKKINKNSEIRVVGRNSPLYNDIHKNSVILQIMTTPEVGYFVIEYLSYEKFNESIGKNGKR